MPSAVLVNFTPNPVDTMIWAFNNMHNPITARIPEYSEETKNEFFSTLEKIPHRTVLEFVNTVWYIEGSRAFQQQLTRTREASYSIQSLRVAQATEATIPDGMDFANATIYTLTIENAFNNYRRMLENGAKEEDARGVLPLNTISPITMSINLRSLFHMLEQRLCRNSQSEFGKIAMQMKIEVINKIDKRFSSFMEPPCYKTKKCNSPVPCGLFPGEKYGEKFIKG